MVMVDATKQKDIENNAKTFSTDAFMQQDAKMPELAEDEDKLDEVAAFWRGYADEAAKYGVRVQSHGDCAGDVQNHGDGKPSLGGKQLEALEQLPNTVNRAMHTDRRQLQAMIYAEEANILAARQEYRKHLEHQKQTQRRKGVAKEAAKEAWRKSQARKEAASEAAKEAWMKALERLRHCEKNQGDAVVTACRLRRQYLERLRSVGEVSVNQITLDNGMAAPHQEP